MTGIDPKNVTELPITQRRRFPSQHAFQNATLASKNFARIRLAAWTPPPAGSLVLSARVDAADMPAQPGRFSSTERPSGRDSTRINPARSAGGANHLDYGCLLVEAPTESDPGLQAGDAREGFALFVQELSVSARTATEITGIPV